MASKQPFRFFDWKNKLAKISFRINKTIKHKILSKSRNALIISSTQDSSTKFNFILNNNNNKEQNKTNQQLKQSFDNKLKGLLKKTWEIYQVNLSKTNSNIDYKDIEEKLKGRQYDAVIVMPEANRDLKGFYKLQQQQFATQTSTYYSAIMKNILAYRLAHKYLATSGVMIYSNSEADFAKVQNKNGIPLVNQPALKNILDSQISYLGVIIGDRDYTDLNSWSVIGLSEQFIKSQNQDFVVKMYGDWADGRNLPMPGSFALFKMNQQGKKSPFVQYL